MRLGCTLKFLGKWVVISGLIIQIFSVERNELLRTFRCAFSTEDGVIKSLDSNSIEGMYEYSITSTIPETEDQEIVDYVQEVRLTGSWSSCHSFLELELARQTQRL